MTGHLTIRPDTATGDVRDRLVATEAAGRPAQSLGTRSAQTTLRAAPRPDRATGTTMSYQLGFASGPGA